MNQREPHRTLILVVLFLALPALQVAGQEVSTGVVVGECPVDMGFFQPPIAATSDLGPTGAGVAPFRARRAFLSRGRPMGSPLAQAPALVFTTDPAAGPREEVMLERLFGTGNRLDGQYARVGSNRLQPQGEPAAGKDGEADFRFEPNNPETEDCLEDIDDCAPFDAVNVYYHIDRFATEFWRDRMGFDPPFQADVVTHIAGDGAFADPSRDLIKLAVGWIFMRNAAKEDEIIYHEYTHLVGAALGFVLDTNSGVEAQAVSEGYADYFAATYTDDPQIGEWVVTCPPRFSCDGPPNDRDLRRLDSDPALWNWQGGSPDSNLKYGICTRYHTGDQKCKTSWNNYIPRYTWAIIWGGLLWDVREALGPETADAIAFEAMRNARGDSETVARAAGRLVEADELLHAGQNRAMIEAAAAARGVGVVTATQDTPIGQSLSLEVFPSPAAGPVTIRATGVDPGVRVRADVFDVLGRQVATLNPPVWGQGSAEFSWAARQVPPGLYFVRVGSGSMTTVRTLSVVR